MSVISNCCGDAVKHEFSHKGKTYQVSPVTQEVKATFEKKLFQKARDAARLLKDCMSEQEYSLHIAKLNDDYISGEYALESKRAIQLLQSNHGGLVLVSLLLGVNEIEALQLMKAKKTELSAMLDIVLRESFALGEEQANADTKSV